MEIATAGEKYNRQLHQNEIKMIKSLAEDFSKKKDISINEAEALLYLSAKYENDQKFQNSTAIITEEQIEKGYISLIKYTQKDIKSAIENLKTKSEGLFFIDTYKESMKPQEYFTSTSEQFKDNNWIPDSTIGLGNQGVGPFVPVTRVGQTLGTATKEISPVIIQSGKRGIQKADKFYDNVTLEVINKANNVAPNLTNKYLSNNVKINQNLIDVITDFNLLGIPSPSKVGYGVGGYGLIKDYLDKKNKE